MKGLRFLRFLAHWVVAERKAVECPSCFPLGAGLGPEHQKTQKTQKTQPFHAKTQKNSHRVLLRLLSATAQALPKQRPENT